KSHSKMTGGTGLGLSIVKHGAALHGAALTLDSTLNVGTRITLTFPKSRK
ncbi:ATP-binding protein, partial [Agathobaculum hominis]